MAQAPTAARLPTGAGRRRRRRPIPRFHLKPEEGTLTVDKAEGKAGAEATAEVKLAPATGYHVATDYPDQADARARRPA